VSTIVVRYHYYTVVVVEVVVVVVAVVVVVLLLLHYTLRVITMNHPLWLCGGCLGGLLGLLVAFENGLETGLCASVTKPVCVGTQRETGLCASVTKPVCVGTQRRCGDVVAAVFGRTASEVVADDSRTAGHLDGRRSVATSVVAVKHGGHRALQCVTHAVW
jgi:hypothetical protein